MLESKEESRSCMKRMNSNGEITEAWGTPSLIQLTLERKRSTLTVIDLTERKLAIHLIRLWWRPNSYSLVRCFFQSLSKVFSISKEITLLSPYDSRAEY